MDRVYAHEQLHSVRLHHINSTNNIMYCSVGESSGGKISFHILSKDYPIRYKPLKFEDGHGTEIQWDQIER